MSQLSENHLKLHLLDMARADGGLSGLGKFNKMISSVTSDSRMLIAACELSRIVVGILARKPELQSFDYIFEWDGQGWDSEIENAVMQRSQRDKGTEKARELEIARFYEHPDDCFIGYQIGEDLAKFKDPRDKGETFVFKIRRTDFEEHLPVNGQPVDYFNVFSAIDRPFYDHICQAFLPAPNDNETRPERERQR